MTSSLDALRHELAAPLPHPDAAAVGDLGRQTADWIARDFATLPEQSVGSTGSRADLEALLREPPPEEGRPFAEVLAAFGQKVAAHSLRPSHPRFLAFIPGAPSFYSVLGDWLCAGTNFFDGVWLEAAGPAQVELVVLDWFKDLLGYPAEAAGILTGGGSEANLTALLVARERLSFAERGRAVLYAGDQRHWSVDRAAKVIGLRPEQLVTLSTDEQFRVRADALAAAVGRDRAAGRVPWVVLANAGSTSTGAVDPLPELAELCRRERLWLHADAAYGWPAVLLPEGKALLRGIAEADSITLDPHKWFAQPYEAGCVLVRDGRLLPDTFSLRPEYMQDVVPGDDEINFCDYGLALTRRFRALKIWLSVKVLGLGWFRAMVRRSCRLAELAELLLARAGGFEMLTERSLGMVCFRYVGRASAEELDRINLALPEALLATGRAFVSSTRLRGRVALRMCFVNWRTTTADVEEVVGLLTTLGARLAETRKEAGSGPRGAGGSPAPCWRAACTTSSLEAAGGGTPCRSSGHPPS